MKKHLFSLFTFCFLVFTLTACGYKPTTHYVKDELGHNSKYYVNMKISVNSAKNSVIIKDAVNDAIISKFEGHLVSRASEADTTMDVSLSSVSTSAIQYDTDRYNDDGTKNSNYGYANLYRTTVKIKVSYTNKNSSGSFSVSDSYEFAVDGSATVSDTAKFQAIKNAASKAFDRVISSIAIRSIKYEYKYYIEDITVPNKKRSLNKLIKKELDNRLSKQLVSKEEAQRIISISIDENKKTKTSKKNEKAVSLTLDYVEDKNKKTIKIISIYSTAKNFEECRSINCAALDALDKALIKMDDSLKVKQKEDATKSK